jgi:hypothetical protein
MDEARAVLERLGRIEALDRSHAPPTVLLAELRALVGEAEAWLAAEPDPGARAERAVVCCRQSLLAETGGGVEQLA